MTDLKASLGSVSQPCPSFEELSCHLDGELIDARASQVESHMAHCAVCSEIARDIAQAGQTGATDCPPAEEMLALLMDQSASDSDIERHLLECDSCAAAMLRMRHQMDILAEPQSLAEATTPRHARRLSELTGQKDNQPRAHANRVAYLLRLPLLIPSAFAAGVTFFLAVQALRSSPSLDLQRGLTLPRAERRIRVSEAQVRESPSSNATIVAKVARGERVKTNGATRGWYAVKLADGTQGWLEERAFE